MIGAIKGIAQVGRYALARKEQDRQARNKFLQLKSEQQHRMMLEQLKNEAWARRLREETERQSLYQKRLLEQYKANQAAEVEKERLKGIAAKEKWDREAEERELKNKLTQAKIDDLLNKAAGTGGYAKKGSSTKSDDLKRLDVLLKLKQGYTGRLAPYEEETLTSEGTTTTKGQRFYGQQSPEMNYIDKLITDLTGKVYGKEFMPPQPKQKRIETFGITGKDLPTTIQNYYNSLLKGGFSPQQAKQMLQQKFGQQSVNDEDVLELGL